MGPHWFSWRLAKPLFYCCVQPDHDVIAWNGDNAVSTYTDGTEIVLAKASSSVRLRALIHHCESSHRKLSIQCHASILADTASILQGREFVVALSVVGPLYDLKPLADLRHIRALHIERAHFPDLSPIYSLDDLRILDITGGTVDLQRLLDRPQLEELSMYNVDITSGSLPKSIKCPIRRLRLPRNLDSRTSGSFIESVATTLDTVDLSERTASDLERCTVLERLRRLAVPKHHSLRKPLSRFRHVAGLVVDDAELADLDAIRHFSKLEQLAVRSNAVRRVPSFATEAHLSELDVRCPDGIGFDPSFPSDRLESLTISCPVDPSLFGLVANTRRLRTLSLLPPVARAMQEAEVDKLRCQSLQQLFLSGVFGSGKTSGRWLAGVPNLQSLEVHGAQFSDLDLLSGVSGLRTVRIHCASDANRTKLNELHELRELQVTGGIGFPDPRNWPDIAVLSFDGDVPPRMSMPTGVGAVDVTCAADTPLEINEPTKWIDSLRMSVYGEGRGKSFRRWVCPPAGSLEVDCPHDDLEIVLGAACEGLARLDVMGHKVSMRIDARLPALRDVSISGSFHKVSIEPYIRFAPGVRRARFTCLESLEAASLLCEWPHLEVLDLDSTAGLQGITWAKPLRSIRQISLKSTSIESLHLLKGATRLWYVNVDHCESLRSAEALESLPALRSVSCVGCRQIDTWRRLVERGVKVYR